MITVAILINGHPIVVRSARNVTEQPSSDKANTYLVDDGTIISHVPSDGAVKLAIEMLRTIKE